MMPLANGSALGGHVVQSLIGRGGMGEVYRARDPELARDVAIKILPQVYPSDRDLRARFEREAMLLASLSHPNRDRRRLSPGNFSIRLHSIAR